MEKLPFIPNQVYRRRTDIHTQFGGNWQSGIAPSSTHPYIFIFTGKTGIGHGYQDGWDNPDVFSYSGEGQGGDMEFTRGNLALRDHIKNGKRVFLFESENTKGLVRFIDELEAFDADYFETPDSSGKMRIGIKFFFKRKSAVIKISRELISDLTEVAAPRAAYVLDEDLVTEKKGFLTSRVGQGAYRKRIIHRWKYKCAITAFDRLDLLVASHIVPWAGGSDRERLDVDNGILLSPTYDALFDRHLITFDGSGKIILSNLIEKSAFAKIAVSGDEKIRDFTSSNLKYLERHHQQFLQKVAGI